MWHHDFGVAVPKKHVDIFTAERTSNLTICDVFNIASSEKFPSAKDKS
jgi:hypothetical protein